jgi:hypothetical protein
MFCLRAFKAGFVITSIVAGFSLTASARILHTKPPPSETWNPWFPLTIGSGIEFETNQGKSQYDFPMLIEYNFSPRLKLSLEPSVSYVGDRAKDLGAVTGFSDLETSIEYEFVTERRYRPALTALGTIKWPTATDPEIGTPSRDYTLGLIVSKDLVYVDLDFSALYTFIGDPKEKDTLELSLAAECPLNHFFDVEAEVVQTIGTGAIRGRPGTLAAVGGGEGNNLTEGTLGLAWHISKRLKVEQGAVLRSDGTWQIVFAWEWSFAGD